MTHFYNGEPSDDGVSQSETSVRKNPSITLRKGKTELKIENASAIIKRINEMYPSEDPYAWPSNKNRIKREISDRERERQKKWMSAAKDWFKTEMFGGIEDFEVVVEEGVPEIINNKEVPVVSIDVKTKPVTLNQLSDAHNQSMNNFYKNAVMGDETDSNIMNMLKGCKSIEVEPHVVQSVNKNAYEIRTQVLAAALEWVKWQFDAQLEVANRLNQKIYLQEGSLTSDQVLEVAKKFYSFVENKRY